MQCTLHNIDIWANNGFTFSASKTKLFSRKRSTIKISLYLNGYEIEQVDDYLTPLKLSKTPGTTPGSNVPNGR